MQLQITNIYSVRFGALNLINETSQWNTFNKKKTLWLTKHCLKGDRIPEHKKAADRTRTGPITDIDSQTPANWNKLTREPSEDRPTVVQLTGKARVSSIIVLMTMHAVCIFIACDKCSKISLANNVSKFRD